MSKRENPLAGGVLRAAKAEHDHKFQAAVITAIGNLRNLFSMRGGDRSFLNNALSEALHKNADMHSLAVVKLFEKTYLETDSRPHISTVRGAIKILSGSDFFDETKIFDGKPTKKIPKEYFCDPRIAKEMGEAGTDVFLIAPVPFMGPGNCEAEIGSR